MSVGIKTKRSRRGLSVDAMWAAVVGRDPAFDGQFVFSVATTGVFCRPSCPSRQAKRENVAFHATCADAEAAGFRACQRCKPDKTSGPTREAETIAAACRMIDAAETPPTLAELARAAGLSPFHFQRRFKAVIGVTPKAYATARRQARVRSALERGATVTDAIYESGFNSSGRFYAGAADALGMTPRHYRNGADGVGIRYAITNCTLGKVLIAATERGVSAVLLGDDAAELSRDLTRRFPKAHISKAGADFGDLIRKVVAFVERPPRVCSLPLDVQGTAFQHLVWSALREIPPGATADYTEIAKRIGRPTAARAVASACAANALAVVVPCHRVVRRDGDLSGYRWGVTRKRRLLDRESET